MQSFSATGSAWAYNIELRKFSGKWLPFLKRLELINARLKKVQIECLDFEKLIEKYDSQSTLFYLDPLYIGGERYYKTNSVNFKQQDHTQLVNVLMRVKGKFILSYYDHEFVRVNYKAFNIVKKSVPKYCEGCSKNNQDKHKPVGHELLIMDY